MKNSQYNCNESTVVIGNSVDINLNDEILCKSTEIRSDVIVGEFNAKRLWGQVKNCKGEPVANTLVKLIKVVCNQYGNKEYIGVAHTITNCEGFYQFDICADDLSCYKILVNKATTGIEAIMVNNGGNCNVCQDPCGGGDGYNPCCPIQYYPVENPAKCQCGGGYNNNDYKCSGCYDSEGCNCNKNQPNLNYEPSNRNYIYK